MRVDPEGPEAVSMRILCVCLGNICRSPTAEAAIREAAQQAGLAGVVDVDSAGTGSWHLGKSPDKRMRRAARAAGLELDGAARVVDRSDFETFDLILAMDRANEADLGQLAPDAAGRAKVRRFRDFEAGAEEPDVPDPYLVGNFAEVVDIARAGAAGVIAHVRQQLDTRAR